MTNKSEPKINVFVSHPSFKANSTEKLVNLLKPLDPGDLLQFIYAKKDIKPSDDWRQWINHSIRKANIFLLPIWKASVDNLWCIYEAGIFEGANPDRQHKRIIMIHDETVWIPEPLKHLQAVSTDCESLQGFLRWFFGSTELTGINKAVNEHVARDQDTIEWHARAISSLFHNTGIPEDTNND